MAQAFTESTVEEAALELLGGLGYAVLHGPEIAPGELLSEREGYGDVVTNGGLNDALLRKLISGEIPAKEAEKCATGGA